LWYVLVLGIAGVCLVGCSGDEDDDDGAANIAPRINAVTNNGPINEGGQVTVTVNVTVTDNDATDLQYAFDCNNDDTFDIGPQAGNTASCPCGDDGNFPINIHVSDPDDAVATDRTIVSVRNVLPTITNVTGGEVAAGASLPIVITAPAPAGDNDPLRYEWDCNNDGTFDIGPQASNSAICLFTQPGTFQVGVRVSDDAPGATFPTDTATVSNDYIAYFGDGWDADWTDDVVGNAPQFNGSGTSGWIWSNHEYISNERPTTTSAPAGQHLTLARFMQDGRLLTNDVEADVWTQRDVNTYIRFYKRQLGGSWFRAVQDPQTLAWRLERHLDSVRYDATDTTLVRITGQRLNTRDHNDANAPLPAGVVVGMAGNCSGAQTPWGTVLTGEENVQDYYGDLETAWTSDQAFVPGVGFDPGSNVTPTFAASTDSEFGAISNLAQRHERDIYGYLSEVDPGAPANTFYRSANSGGNGRGHRKIGSLGRARWENAVIAVNSDFRLLNNRPIVIYAGDDRRGGRIYKWVSAAPYQNGMTRAEVRALLDTGTLYGGTFRRSRPHHNDMTPQRYPGRHFHFLLGIFYALASLAIPGYSTDNTGTLVQVPGPAALSTYDPLATARASIGQTVNLEAVVPPQCYTKTAGDANPCWTCHTHATAPNYLMDWRLQEEYAFSNVALTNHWQNLFTDRSAVIASISDDAALAYIRADNYTPLRQVLTGRSDYPGWVPDLDFAQGFDPEGFANDGSNWRAIRYKPFLGTFWPTNGSTDDVLIRLPAAFRTDANGVAAREIYKINLALLEAAIGAGPGNGPTALARVVEPLDETVAGADLDGDGQIAGRVIRLNRLPAHYVGGARDIAVPRYLYPQGTEFLHTVRYIDPEQPTLLSTRMKEVRYSRKVRWLDTWALLRAYEKEHDDKDEGKVSRFSGSPLVGLQNAFGWQLQGFIEDAKGQLRLQTEEEHRFCMGCHSIIGVTVDQTFTLPRKVPGAAGWRHQDVRGIADVPQHGHPAPETLTYFQRTVGGDEFRANTEALARFFPEGALEEAEVRRAAPGGDQDMTFLITPSRERALLLNKAYMVLVREQTFAFGRDAVITPPANVHRVIENGSTALHETGRIFRDGRLWLDWE
jgi:hypothetical protein